jgi:hypothetical protein
VETITETHRSAASSGRRLGVAGCVALGMAIASLIAPAASWAARPDLERVVVSRDEGGRVTFRVEFAAPLALSLDDTVQIAIDADRDPGTGIDGLDYSLDWSFGSAALLTAIDGEPEPSHPSSFHFTKEPGGFQTTAMTFSIAADDIGSPRRFDFYAFVEKDAELDEAPSHVLFSAGSAPWTYPTNEPETGETYPTETYVDGSDFTLSERGGLFLALVVGGLLGVGAILGLGGWSVERWRKRKRVPPTPDDAVSP